MLALGLSFQALTSTFTSTKVGPRAAASVSPLESEVASRARAQEAYGSLPLYFIENRGQVDARVAYYIQGRETVLYFTSQGLTLALTGTETYPTDAAVSLQRPPGRRWPSDRSQSRRARGSVGP